MQDYKRATLILDDGSRFEGYSFGYEAPVAGEVVFNTAMTGYTESFTDPSYRGQILVMTYPLVGNYGVPSPKHDENGIAFFRESDEIHPLGIIVSDYSEEYSHWNSEARSVTGSAVRRSSASRALIRVSWLRPFAKRAR